MAEIQTNKISEELQLVCFKVAKEEYAVNIMKVQEIIRVTEITSVPKAKDYMKGIINLRGTVVPVVNMHMRFGFKTPQNQEQCRIVVVNINGKATGLIVDSVTEVLRTLKTQFEPAPSSVSGIDGKFIEAIGKLNGGKRILILINVDSLLPGEEPT
jgi:purine-binding chemotaxis protein CheW